MDYDTFPFDTADRLFLSMRATLDIVLIVNLLKPNNILNGVMDLDVFKREENYLQILFLLSAFIGLYGVTYQKKWALIISAIASFDEIFHFYQRLTFWKDVYDVLDVVYLVKFFLGFIGIVQPFGLLVLDLPPRNISTKNTSRGNLTIFLQKRFVDIRAFFKCSLCLE